MKLDQVGAAIRALGYDPRRVSGIRMSVDPLRVEVDTVEWDEDTDSPVCRKWVTDDGRREGEFATRTDVHIVGA